jgi:hypothetical protein
VRRCVSVIGLVALLLACAHTRAGSLCNQIVGTLLPQHVEQGSSDDHGAGFYWFRYTPFCTSCDGPEFVLASGMASYPPHAGDLIQRDLFLATLPYFRSGTGRANRRFSDVDSAARLHNDPLIARLSAVLLFLRYGETADTFFAETDRGKRIVSDLPDGYAVRGSDLRNWYTCQSCANVPEFTRTMAQDLRTARLGRTQRGLYVVTTRPRVIAVELADDGNHYLQCPSELSGKIEAR